MVASYICKGRARGNRKIFSPLGILLVLLLTNGCSSAPTPSDIASQAPTSFAVEPRHTQVFFYAVYDKVTDRPYFNTEFKFRVDGSYIENITADQFIQREIPPGDHTFDVDEIGWTGNLLNHATVKAHIDLGKATFIVANVVSDESTTLSEIDFAQGEKAVLARIRKCLCQTPLQQRFDIF